MVTYQLLLLGLVCQTDGPQTPRDLLELLNLLLDPFDILEPELGRDDLHITTRVDIALDVNDLGVIECTDDLENTVDRTDVRQEGVSETGTGGCTGGQTGNIDTRQERRDLRFGLVNIAQPVETGIGDGNTGLLRVAAWSVAVFDAKQSSPRVYEGYVHGSVGEVGGFTQIGLGEGVEEGRLSDIGYTDDTNLPTSSSAPALTQSG